MRFSKYLKCQNGATVIEYVIIAAGVALGIMVAVFAFGGDLGAIFDNLATATNS